VGEDVLIYRFPREPETLRSLLREWCGLLVRFAWAWVGEKIRRVWK
jgi:hypothetical protein